MLTSADGTFDIFSGNVPRLREDRIKKAKSGLNFFLVFNGRDALKMVNIQSEIMKKIF